MKYVFYITHAYTRKFILCIFLKNNSINRLHMLTPTTPSQEIVSYKTVWIFLSLPQIKGQQTKNSFELQQALLLALKCPAIVLRLEIKKKHQNKHKGAVFQFSVLKKKCFFYCSGIKFVIYVSEIKLLFKRETEIKCLASWHSTLSIEPPPLPTTNNPIDPAPPT